MDDTDFDTALSALGQLLSERGQRYAVLVIGGGALQLLGLIARPTKDLDVVAMVDQAQLVTVESLPAQLQDAVDDTARVLRLPRTWLNAGPRALMRFGLPEGVVARAHLRTWGGLTVYLADRRDQIYFKLYAAVDQGPRSKHFADLRDLKPTTEELNAAAVWTRTHDPSPGFQKELDAAIRHLRTSDGER